nr:ribonuclease H-like domain-containing protein [Tanacetum cinerariifolium]
MVGDDNNGDHPKTSNTSPPVPLPTQQIPHTVSSIKLPILKKGEYEIWAMKMEHYLSHPDYQRKGEKSKDHFDNGLIHKIADAKEMWEAIKSRFGGNDESKKMQKYMLKQQFKGFSVSTSKGLHKGYGNKTKDNGRRPAYQDDSKALVT